MSDVIKTNPDNYFSLGIKIKHLGHRNVKYYVIIANQVSTHLFL